MRIKNRWFSIGGLAIICWLNGFAGYGISAIEIRLTQLIALLLLGIFDLATMIFIVRLWHRRQNQLAYVRETLGWVKQALNHKKPRLEQHMQPEALHVLQQFTNQLQAALRQKQEPTSHLTHHLSQLQHATDKVLDVTQDLEAVSANNREILNHLNRAGQLADGALSKADRGKEVLADSVQAVGAITDSFQKITDIIAVIDKIAYQTNLLALNASIEAARAGQAGAGFAVVADEVRNLAQSTAKEASDTQILVKETLQRVSHGEKLMRNTQTAFQGLSRASVEMAQIVSSVQKDSFSQAHRLDRGNYAIMKTNADMQAIIKPISNGAASPLDPKGLKQPRKFRFRPQWVPQSQFAGYYVAHERGFYRDQGIEIEMLDGGPDTNPMSELVKGQLEFGTTWLAPSMIMASQGADLVLLSQIIQRNGLLLVTLTEKGYQSVEDLRGKRVGVWGGEFNYPVQALDRELGLGLILVQQGFEMSELLNGEVDAALCMSFNEMFTFDDRGIDRDLLKIFRFDELGLQFPEDGIYTSQRVAQKYPQACKAFASASLQGWQYTAAHPQEALDIVMEQTKRSPFPTTREHQERMLNEILQMVGGTAKNQGELTLSDFDSISRSLEAIGQIDQVVEYNQFYRHDLVA